ncbi:MAG: protein kinase [Myxococcota bacterium]
MSEGALGDASPTLAGRYELLESLGSGTFGEVFRARDARLGCDVALKVLRRMDGAARLGLKTEFRSLARIAHEGIVHMRSLHTETDEWFVTMELLEGPTWLEYVREGDRLDRERLLDVLGQLKDALSALHAAGQVHCDLKPSNVRVVQGRVRILDFGLTLGARAPGLVGTPAYIAPEHAAGERCTAASDWYAVGVMLHEALTGHRPFEGRPLEVLVRKQRYAAKPVQGPLASLAAALLERDPKARAGGDAIARALGEGANAPARAATVFVGRQSQLQLLDARWRSLGENATVVSLIGKPGSGKTALLEQFLQGVDPARIFRSRSYEGACVPFGGADALVDEIAERLRPMRKDPSWLPTHFDALMSLFPVLEGAVENAPQPARPKPPRNEVDPVVVRRHAFDALRELLKAMASQLGGALVLAVDDLHWGDEDGVELLNYLAEGRDAVNMLLIVVARQQEIRARPWLRSFIEAGHETIALGPLSRDHSILLAQTLLGSEASERASRIADVAQGDPLLLEMLTRTAAGDVSELGTTVRRQTSELAPTSLRLLRSVCLAGQPVPRDAWSRQHGPSAERAVAELQQAGLLVGSGPSRSGDQRLQPYHDRIREAVVSEINPEDLPRVHETIAKTWMDIGGDPETIARHLSAAGNGEAAAEWTIRAADAAAASYAWARAAELYRRALKAPSAQSRRVLLAALGDMLGHQGRGAAAANAYKEALDHPPSGELDDVELLRRAAEHLMRCGEMIEGVRTLDDALQRVHLRLPRHPVEAALRIAKTRTQLRLRGLEYTNRPAQAVPRSELHRVDLCWSAGIGLSSVDSLRGAAMQSEGLLLALRAGEPTRVARALAYEAAFQGNQGPKNAERSWALLEAAKRIAGEEQSTYLTALVEGARCVVEFHLGRWQRVREGAARAERRFYETSEGMVKEISTVQLMGLAATTFQGDFVAVNARRSALIGEAESRSDRFTLASFVSGFLSLASIARDDTETARAAAIAATSDFHSPGYVLQDFFDLWAQTQFDLYEGHVRRAWSRVRRGWRPFSLSLLARLPLIRAFAHELAGRAALAAWNAGQRDAERAARKHYRALRSEPAPWVQSLADALEANVMLVAGKPAQGAQLHAARSLSRAQMHAHAATLRLAVNPEDGEARETLQSCGVVRLDRWTRLWVPSWRP